MELKKEADYFGDIVIVPYMDNYDLVVLKTIAICEYGVSGVVRSQLHFFLSRVHLKMFLVYGNGS